jgi:hypothetical protein
MNEYQYQKIGFTIKQDEMEQHQKISYPKQMERNGKELKSVSL